MARNGQIQEEQDDAQEGAGLRPVACPVPGRPAAVPLTAILRLAGVAAGRQTHWGPKTEKLRASFVRAVCSRRPGVRSATAIGPLPILGPVNSVYIDGSWLKA